ncbi:GroES-like protein [Cylindrobasidium torrendii FP15055 ss-10]|uniref:GroES-like protein n=1 Tax=Cylindrobasidium torrendii FP15055 ss-10 TaxID=1314674 RepID=A0A0D7B8F9_9AGAR|nr:GroES-like protein [Cylindrobasidium torrendii FP15055 ss-10]
MSTQLALHLEKHQGDFVVHSKQIPKSVPPGEVLIKVQAAALNPSDWKLQEFGAPWVKDYPVISGTDIAGEIQDVGEGVTRFKKGDRIATQGFYANDRGAFQEYAVIPADFVAKIPETLTYEQGASIPVGFVAAITALFAEKPLGFSLNPECAWPAPQYAGHTIVVIGGSTSVGQYAIQLSKFLGFSDIVTYASQKHHAFLVELGATKCIDRAVPLDALDTMITGPVKVAFDCVGSKEAQETATRITSADGTAITVYFDTRSEESKAAGKDKPFFLVLGSSYLPGHEEFGVKMWLTIERLLKEGVIKPNRYEVIPGGLNGVASGLERLKRGEVSGLKLVVRPHETTQ